MIRKTRSNPAKTLAAVRSRSGTTMRNRHQASQATRSTILRPPTTGPSPKSYCSHNPGSVIQGRCTRVLPSRHWVLISDSARRVVRSVPTYPMAINRSWALSPRILPLDSDTQPSRTSFQSSMIFARRVAGGSPAARSSTAFLTVLWEQPQSSAVARNEPVRS